MNALTLVSKSAKSQTSAEPCPFREKHPAIAHNGVNEPYKRRLSHLDDLSQLSQAHGTVSRTRTHMRFVGLFHTIRW